jgi:hypothetical protein
MKTLLMIVIWSLDYFLLLTCYQQPQYELEKVVTRLDDGFLETLISPTLPSNCEKIIKKKLIQHEKQKGAKESHSHNNSITEKYYKSISKNADSNEN